MRLLVAVALLAARQDPQNGAVVLKSAAGAEILRYQLVRPEGSPLSVESACYFHPIATPAGVVVTDVAPSDHRHHRGGFLAWVEMHGKKDADFWGWGEHAPTKGRKIVNVEVADLSGGAFRARNEWRAEETVILREDLKVGTRAEASAHIIDLAYTLTPEEDLTLSRWAFSGFCVRFRKDGKVEAVGPEGPVKHKDPKHTEPASDWPAAPWYAFTITLDDGTVAGAAVLDHPSNPPTLWHNHRGTRMINPCIVAPGEVKLKAKEPLLLRYRVVAFDGAAPRGLLDRLSAEWKK